MTINREAYLKAAFPPPLRQPVPRNFTLYWDNHKILSKYRDKDDWNEAWGTQYPIGTVTLENGMFFRNMDEMKAHYRAMGDIRITWLDEQEQGDAQEGNG